MPHRELVPLAPQTTIGPYRVVRELGRGGMGVVYEGLHEHLRRRVAIKLMRPELAKDPTHVERFVREGRAACNIRHPNVIDVYEFSFADGAPYLVMDYLEGETLAERLMRIRRFRLPELVETYMPLLSAMSAAHAAGIVHRDLKPSNIMLARRPDGLEVPKLLDFGTSKLIAQDEIALTQSATFLGTPYYMAPEQARSARHADARSDQYALGVMFYECVSGARPFEGDNPYEVLHALMSAPVAPPSALVPELPRALDAVVLRALSRDPAQRFASVRGLGAALLAFATPEVERQWRAEFGPASAPAPAVISGSAAVTTLRDRASGPRHERSLAGDSSLAPSPDVAGARTRSRVWSRGWLALVIALIAATAAAWTLSRRRDPTGSSAHVVSTPAPTPASTPTPAPSPTAAPPSAATAPVEPRPAPQPSDAMHSGETPSDSAREASPAGRTPRRKLPAPARARVTLGDNGAPILE